MPSTASLPLSCCFVPGQPSVQLCERVGGRLRRRWCGGLLTFCSGMHSETMRKEASSIPKLALNQAMKKIGERVLYTNFIFQINGIYGNNLEFPEGFEKALITISWNGWSFNKRIMAESVAHNDTATFEWKAIPDKENANSSVKKKKKGLSISEDFDAQTKIGTMKILSCKRCLELLDAHT